MRTFDTIGFPGRRPPRAVPGRLGSLQEELAGTEFELGHALRSALALREPVRHLVAHSTRVLVLVDWLASLLGIADPEYAHLQTAAQLHEIGMIAVPTALLESRGPLSARELELVRRQAEIGSEIVRGTHSERTAMLIRSQYLDHDALAAELPAENTDLLLAGILRVADVFDTMGHPRPYQAAWSVEERLDVLRAGSGVRYHPAVVEALVNSWRLHRSG